ncbi:MAG: response regulator [Prolixibacteraceae bacterium]|jgi:CheY-like chemotaxis protein|nr:response regulator [Prolixibacteraceae bacterium]
MRILVADDNPVNQKLVYYTLKRFYEIETANNGEEVLSLVKSKPIDLILMDLAMPVMDGVRATEEIRMMEKEGNNRIPIIFITTSDIEKDRVNCLSIGADDYLVKPVDTEVLIAKVRHYLNHEEL